MVVDIVANEKYKFVSKFDAFVKICVTYDPIVSDVASELHIIAFLRDTICWEFVLAEVYTNSKGFQTFSLEDYRLNK